MKTTSRRSMLRTGALMSAGIATGGTLAPSGAGAACSCGNGTEWEREYTFGHTVLFMDEYLDGTLQILGSLSGEIDHIGELAERAKSVVKAGGTVWNSANIGHMPSTEQSEKRRGNPGVMKTYTARTDTQNKAEMAETDFSGLKKGDMIVTCYCNKSLKEARDRGAYVVTVRELHQHEFWPEGYVLPNEDNLMLKDVSNEVLHSYIPYEQGLVHPPEIPYMAICPSCTTALGALYWMLSAEIAARLADPKAQGADRAAEYLPSSPTASADPHGPYNAIRETAVEMTRRVRDGGRWFAKSVEHTASRANSCGSPPGRGCPIPEMESETDPECHARFGHFARVPRRGEDRTRCAG